MYFAGDNITYYFILNMLNAAAIGINCCTFPTFMQKKFGLKHSTELYGFIFITFAMTGLIGPLLIKFVLSDEMTSYLIIYYLGAVLSLIAMTLLIFLNTDKFQYNNKIDSKEYKEQL